MSIFKKVGLEIEKIWAAITGELKKIVPEAIAVVNTLKSIVSNPTVDAVLEAISGGKITPTMIATVNMVLADLMKGLIELEAIESLTPEQVFAYYATKFGALTDAQKSAFYGQLATEIVKVTGGSEQVTESELKAIIQWLYTEAKDNP